MKLVDYNYSIHILFCVYFRRVLHLLHAKIHIWTFRENLEIPCWMCFYNNSEVDALAHSLTVVWFEGLNYFIQSTFFIVCHWPAKWSFQCIRITHIHKWKIIILLKLSIHFLIRRSGRGGAGVYPSGHRAKGGVHPGQVASPSQGHIETNNHTCSHSLLRTI